MRVAAAIRILAFVVCGMVLALPVQAQTFGIDLHNALMPASAGMAGASLTRPQDLLSSINANPATLTQFGGTQFSFGSGWAEPTYYINQLAPLPAVGVTPYTAKSDTPGASAPNVGFIQDFSDLGLPVTVGTGLFANAGGGTNFRDVPQSNGTSSHYLALDVTSAAAVDLTDNLALGAAITIGNSYLDGPFTNTGGMAVDYALRGTLGVNYWLLEDTSLGAYWQSRKDFTFHDAVLLPGRISSDIKLDHPQNVGIGLADSRLLDGRLLMAVDVLYKVYSDADFFRSIYNDQWVFQTGLQFAATQRLRLRLGYAYNTNPMRETASTSVGGVLLPDGLTGARYIQGQAAAISQNRITAGIGMIDLLPGMDVDVFAGGMFQATDQFATTIATVESYWVGAGVTRRFGRGS